MTLSEKVQMQAAERVDALLRAGWLTGPDVMSEAIKHAASIRDPENLAEWFRFEVLLIAMNSPDRLWWNDLEQDYPPDYVAALTEWAGITAGHFTPTSMTQTWTGDDQDPIILTFDWNGASHRFEVPLNSDWLDLSLIFRLNTLFGPDSPRFVHLEQDDQTAQILFVTPTEISFLRERGWILYSTAEEVPKREPIDWNTFFQS